MNAKWIIGAAAALTATSVMAAGTNLDAKTAEIMKRDFQDKGIALASRVNQDELQTMCSKYVDKLPVKLKAKMEAGQLATMKYPADGKYMGNWKAGETLAQSGKGMTWSDKADEPAGGNCYNCHQLSVKEIAYGTIGPSLLKYGVQRGDGVATQRHVYEHIYNAKAFQACANMPRFGQMNILTESQIKDLVALLLDPESPVNK